jgi:hypothetical protein
VQGEGRRRRAGGGEGRGRGGKKGTGRGKVTRAMPSFLAKTRKPSVWLLHHLQAGAAQHR